MTKYSENCPQWTCLEWKPLIMDKISRSRVSCNVKNLSLKEDLSNVEVERIFLCFWNELTVNNGILHGKFAVFTGNDELFPTILTILTSAGASHHFVKV